MDLGIQPFPRSAVVVLGECSERRRDVLRYVRIGMLAGFAVILVMLVDLPLLRRSIAEARWRIFIVGAALTPLIYLIRSVRLQYLLREGGKDVALADCARVSVVGVAMSLVLPGGSGDVAKSYYGYHLTGIREEMLSTSVVEKMIGLFSVFILGAVSFVWVDETFIQAVSFAGILVVGVLLLAPGILPWKTLAAVVRRVLRRELDPGRLRRGASLGGRPIGIALGLSMAIWGVTIVQLYFFAHAFGAHVSMAYLFSVYPLVVVMSNVPVTAGSVGTFEGGIVFFFHRAGVEPTVSLPVAFAVRVVTQVGPPAAGRGCRWWVKYAPGAAPERPAAS